ncbi:PadR family transcriptional regulator [Candidatus Bipolaricaulota bacterium]|nr:PadR family transcriptional regulator [Candidatus Bipolaricaulota bacterium]
MERVRSEHLKFYILKLLLKGRYTGYGLMKAIEEETGFWRPSTGSLYPLLSRMREEGLIAEVEGPEGKRWEVTPKGRELYTKATEAKRKLFQDMRESMLVFAKAFGRTDLELLADRLGRLQEQRDDLGGIAILFLELHDALWSLPPLSEEAKREAATILKRARDELRALAERLRR